VRRFISRFNGSHHKLFVVAGYNAFKDYEEEEMTIENRPKKL
jgi:hypothetical protein